MLIDKEPFKSIETRTHAQGHALFDWTVEDHGDDGLIFRAACARCAMSVGAADDGEGFGGALMYPCPGRRERVPIRQ